MLLQGFIYSNNVSKRRPAAGLVVKCSGIGLGDFIGGDLVKFDIGQWLSDVEEHKALAIYPPHEGGYEGRYLNRLIRQGYYFLDLSARGLGDPETTLTKVHPVCPVSTSREATHSKVVLSKAELQFLALLPTLRPNVRVVAECGNCIYLHNCKLNYVQEKVRVETTQRDSWTNRGGSLTGYSRRQRGTWKCSSGLFCHLWDSASISGRKPKMELINNVFLLYPSITRNIMLKSEAHSPIGHV
ncbi:hypothetical protein NC653_031820 [Populus alba x Populus x berolinensis]|uniref:Uncharacterized protein n=1 Tax=Populus alba x Populus x berolinensis TaxID=444605 RepID=A0AAD6LZP6_9ROSI|nr:hypothetical protein NC653_031820 [Populus alba x Populus x berolinensis]